jgi:hypothetical protein
MALTIKVVTNYINKNASLFETCANISEINALLSAKFASYNPLNFSRLVIPKAILVRFNDSLYSAIIEAPLVTEAPLVKTPKPLSKKALKKLASEAKKATKVAAKLASQKAFNEKNAHITKNSFLTSANETRAKIANNLTNWCIKNNAFIDCQNSPKNKLKFVFAEV